MCGSRGANASAWIVGRGLGEEIELAGIRDEPGRNCFVVATYLGVVVVLEVERELHQRVGDVGRRLVGDGELVFLFCAAFAGHRLYSAISVLVRKLLPSMTTVSTWWSIGRGWRR